MNILPKKKWHVRTKENMARVRRDEKKAAEEEEAILNRQLTATNEARMQALRRAADDRMKSSFELHKGTTEEDYGLGGSTDRHVNFFEDLERDERTHVAGTNKEYEAEKAKEQREWNSKMGIQKMLGEDAPAKDGRDMWYAKMPLRRGVVEMRKIEEQEKMRQAHNTDTAVLQKKDSSKRQKKRRRRSRSSASDTTSSDDSHLQKRKDDKKKRRKRKKKKKSRSSSDEVDEEEERRRYEEEKKKKLMALRDERLKRERMEQAKTHLLLQPQLAAKERADKAPKYNSMFNPEFARKK